MKKALGMAIGIVGLATAGALLTGAFPTAPRALLLWTHVLGVVLFVGNALTGAAWFGLAEAAGSTRVLAFAAKTLCRLDLAFTAPGTALAVVSGVSLAPPWGGLPGPGWLAWGLGLFLAAGAAWAGLLVPMQLSLWAQAEALPDGPLPPGLRAALRRYYVAGGLTGTLLLSCFSLMLLKP